MADARVEALRSSVARLGGLASTMADADLTRPAYPADWKIADVLSHIGSGAIIMLRRLEDTLAGTDTPDDFAPGVWDAWNAKAPAAQRDDALAADAALLERIDRVTDRERDRFSMGMGPMSLDFDAFVGMRLNEHAFHTWDIEVVVDPAATIPEPVAAVVVDNLEMIARYTAKPSGDTATITVATTKPPRRFTVALTPESVTFTPTTAEAAADLDLTAEAFARLVYGRLDPRHTPRNDDDPGLDKLRRVFPGP
jgi:uncharacterized protein (TIGR03083 family)